MTGEKRERKISELYSESGIRYDEHSDKLTGCRLHAQFDSELESMVMAADDDFGEISIAMFDIDHFKNINDRYGDKVGDAVLITVAGICKFFHDKGHYVYRYGGDCFAIIMNGVEKEEAFLQIEKIRKSLNERLWSFLGSSEPLQISISVGVAAYGTDATNVVELLRKAEGALYRAKSTGRNKVCLARDEKLVTRTTHYTTEQLQRLSGVAKSRRIGEAILLREALDDLLKKYDDKSKSPNGKTVLIVDDAPFMRVMLRSILTKEGYIVVEAANGASGIDKYNDNAPDILLLNIVMPEMNGLDFLNKIEKKPNSRIVMISAKSQASIILESILLGADFFIAKPFSENCIVSWLARLHNEPLLTVGKLEQYRAYYSEKGLLSSDDTPLPQKEIDVLTTL